MKEELILTRLEELIQKGEKVRDSGKVIHENIISQKFVDEGLFMEWKTNCLSFIEMNFRNTVYFDNFKEEVKSALIYSTIQGLAVLLALKEDLEKGYLTDYRTLIIADVFTDFLEMCEHLFRNDYIQPSASLCGAVLEEGLRNICRNKDIKIKNDDNISSLNQKLANKNIYTRLVQKKIQVWNQIRDYADHGNFVKLENAKGDIKDMIKGVIAFLSEHLK